MAGDKRYGLLIVSDTRSSGENDDLVAPLVEEVMTAEGFALVSKAVIPDEVSEIREQLIHICDSDGVGLVFTCGGTGLGARDVTPEATKEVCQRDVPGLAELLRLKGSEQTPYSWLSRAYAGIRGITLIVNLPGSPEGVKRSIELLLPILDHALQVAGGRHSSHAHG